jgi:hypothetical protein
VSYLIVWFGESSNLCILGIIFLGLERAQIFAYSLFIMLLKEMVLMELKGQPGAAPAASPLLSSQSSD